MAEGTRINSGNACEGIEYVPAIILYPSFATPAIITKGDALEILILGKSAYPITKANIAYQLRIDESFDSEKYCWDAPLPMDAITIKQSQKFSDKIVITNSKSFLGIIDERIKSKISSPEAASVGISDVFKKGNYDLVYSVQIKNNGLFYSQKEKPGRGIFNLIWLPYKIGSQDYFSPEIISKDQCSRDHIPLNYKLGNDHRLIVNDIYSNLIHSILDNLNKNNIQGFLYKKYKKPWWKYCFKDGIPSLYNFDGMNPIQAYHPVFYFENLDAPNIAHLADIHLSARQHMFKQSQARVINYPGDLAVSPKIGEIINCSKDNFENILKQFGESQDVDIILISGDLIDYLQSLFAYNFNLRWKMRSIWILVNSSKENLKKHHHYKSGVDLITFFSILLKFYRDYKKPIFIVKGNHDAYCEPFGIAPRAVTKGDLIRANENIPADHNLTTFEALLLFGESYHEHNDMFDKKMWIWYHTYLTPFTDFAIKLPNHYIVGLGWGDSEDVIGTAYDSGQDFLGHLPRSDNAISDDEMKLINLVLNSKGESNLILMTHFTFISYRDFIPISTQTEGTVSLVIVDGTNLEYGKYDWGTFESHREFYSTLKSDVQLVLSGHSHRKALYSLLNINASATTRCHKIDNFFDIDRRYKYPIIIVSDSVGPIPRCNNNGELNGRGSDTPSATKIKYASNGFIKSISTVASTEEKSKPRFVVAVDFYDLLEKQVIEDFGYAFYPKDEDTLPSYNFDLRLYYEIKKLASVDKTILLYAYDSGVWFRIEMEYENDDKRWQIKKTALFRDKFLSKDSKIFIAIKFNPLNDALKNQYDFSSYWCFPIRIDTKYAPAMKIYKIVRDKNLAEYPDFKWYRKYFNN